MNHDPAPLDRRFLLGGLAGAAGISALAAMSKAGPLNPPAGAVTSTSKPLGEIEPRTPVNAVNTPGGGGFTHRITQPGSYYLTGDIQGLAGQGGIQITSPAVTLDLCGFAIRGGAASGDGISGGAAAINDVTVINGHVSGWGAAGVTFFGGSHGVRIVGITARSNAVTGIYINTGAVVDCTAISNGQIGIHAVVGCTVERCGVTGNSIGIFAESSTRVTGCTAVSNTVDGIRAGTQNVLDNNICRSNPTGIRAFAPGAATGSNRMESNFVAFSTGFNYKIDSTQNLLIRNTSAAALGGHWNVAAGNYIHVLVPSPGPAFSGINGGAPIGPLGYDPNANFTIS